jgi:uncharacterized protein
MQIGLLSDTHSYLDEKILEYFKDCDELWHAGDVGNEKVLHQLESFKPVKAVYGNIDTGYVKQHCPLDLRFDCEGIDVWITHIGGYPGKYNKRVRDIMRSNPPKLFICGHSHILKVVPDRQYDLLHINPGACGHEGFHQVRTIIRFSINDKKIQNLEVIELGKRGSL